MKGIVPAFFGIIALGALIYLMSGNTNQATSVSNISSTPTSIPTIEVKPIYETISAIQARQLIKEKKIDQVIDIRTPQEIEEGVIEGALNINYQSDDFTQKISQLDKTKRYLIYCRSGSRSSRAMRVFEDQKFNVVYNLKGGILEWQESQEKQR